VSEDRLVSIADVAGAAPREELGAALDVGLSQTSRLPGAGLVLSSTVRHAELLIEAMERHPSVSARERSN
jgi:hypothetical protein